MKARNRANSVAWCWLGSGEGVDPDGAGVECDLGAWRATIAGLFSPPTMGGNGTPSWVWRTACWQLLGSDGRLPSFAREPQVDLAWRRSGTERHSLKHCCQHLLWVPDNASAGLLTQYESSLSGQRLVAVAEWRWPVGRSGVSCPEITAALPRLRPESLDAALAGVHAAGLVELLVA